MYINGSTQNDAVDSVSSAATNSFNASSQWNLSGGGSWTAGTSWLNFIIPSLAKDVATFGNTITAPSTVTLDGSRTVGSVVFNSSSQSYTIAPGTGGSLTLSQPNGTAAISDLAGSHTISAPVSLTGNAQFSVTGAADTLTFSGPVSGAGNLIISGAGTVILSGTSGYSGTTTISTGGLTIAYNGSVASTVLSTSAGAVLTINGAVPANANISGSGTTVFGASIGSGVFSRTIGNLNLVNGTVVTVANASLIASRTVLITSALNFAGTTNAWQGRLNLTDNDLIVAGGSLTNITNQIKAGYGAVGTYWNGSSGILSSTAAANTMHLTALGAIQSTGGPFDGMTPNTTNVLVKYTYLGDTNLDGKVDGTDYSRIDSAYLTDLTQPGTYTGWYNGDFNYDTLINGSDYTLMDNSFNSQGAQLSAELGGPAASITAQIAGGTSVPEPGMLSVLAMAGVTLLGRRNRQSKFHR